MQQQLPRDTFSLMQGCHRLWLGDEGAIAQTRLFRRTVYAQTGIPIDITLYADANYQIWINGTYLGRGPAYHHPHRWPIQNYDLSPHVVEGCNVVAVLVHSPGICLHNYVGSGTPGLVARIEIGTNVLNSDSSWKATDLSGWSNQTPRRSWAIGFMECFDARVAPIGWHCCDFDDSKWSAAEEHEMGDGQFINTDLPSLRHTFQPAVKLIHQATTSCEVHPLTRDMKSNEIGAYLMNEAWSRGPDYDSMEIKNLDARKGTALVFDLGRQYTGGVTFNFHSDSDGVVDIGWGELLERERPALMRKGHSYVDRYIARPGFNHWLPMGYSAGRYFCLILRGFSGNVRFSRVGMLASEPALDWSARFECSDDRLNAIWDLCERTIRIGTQEGLIDCPTREQAPYVGDANHVAGWISRLTGDYSYWCYLVREAFVVQGRQGLIKTALFSGQSHLFLDYQLLAIVGARQYVYESGDIETASLILPAARRIVEWFINRTDPDGWLMIDWQDLPNQASFVDAPAFASDPLIDPGMNLFIDHPGLGWHNVQDPGLDRRGRNAALHALFAHTLRAIADLMDLLGRSGSQALRVRADRLVSQIENTFYCNQESAFVDGIVDGEQVTQVSQQTNTLCAMVGAGPLQPLMNRLLRDDPDMARCGPYFHLYMLPLMVDAGLIGQALNMVRQKWGALVDRGATTMWETFSGDELDSLCHPWACVPVDFLSRYIVGIGSLLPDGVSIELRPQTSLLDYAEATIHTCRGPVTLGWRDGVLFGELPNGLSATLYLAGGPVGVQGRWRQPV